MIAGISHSLRNTFAKSQRSAANASDAANKIALALASGKKVASVKDDSSAYLMAQNLKNELPTWQVRADTLDRAEVGLDWMNLVNDTTYQILSKLDEILLSAQSYSIGSSQRQALQAQWNQTIAEADSFSASNNNPVFNGTGAGSGWNSASNAYDWGAIDSFYGPDMLNAHPNGSAWAGWLSSATYGAVLNTFDLVNATAGDITSAKASIDGRRNTSAQNWYRHYAADGGRVERLQKVVEQSTDRINSFIGSIEDIDLGELSAQLSNHNAKQELASTTLKQAINTYSNYAQSLMGSILRTQNSIRA